MSNSGKRSVQLRAASRAARPTTKLGASLREPGAGLGAAGGQDRRGDAPGSGLGQQLGRQRDPRVPGAPGEAGPRRGEERGSGAGTGARGSEAAGFPHPETVPGAGRQGRRCWCSVSPPPVG